jgi:hypothetical protein
MEKLVFLLFLFYICFVSNGENNAPRATSTLVASAAAVSRLFNLIKFNFVLFLFCFVSIFFF